MQIGTFSLMQHPSDRSESDVYRNEMAQAVEAEKLGYDIAWFAEHHFSPYGIAPSIHLNMAHLAALTTKIRIGNAVTILPFFHPFRLAEEVAMLDILSQGRISWGMGRGYQRHEFDAWEIPIAESRERFNEAIEIILQAWQEGPFEHRGKYWNFDKVEVFPKPVQKPRPPMYMAGISPPSVSYAAEQGFHLLTDQFQPTPMLAGAAKKYDETLKANGIDGKGMEKVALRQIFVDETKEKAEAIAAPGLLWYYQMIAKVGSPARHGEKFPAGYETYNMFTQLTGMANEGGDNFIKMLFDQVAICGTAEEVTDRLIQLHEAGFTGVIAWQNFGDIPHEATLASMRRFADKVAPNLPS